MRQILLLLSMVSFPVVLQAQTHENLFCGTCGKLSELTATYCFSCGHRLDKSALVSRLKDRLARADSLKQHVIFALGEISVLVEELAETRARELVRRGAITRPPRQKTQIEKTLDIVFPVVVGSAAVYFLGRQFYRTD